MSDRERAGLHGAVRLCTQETVNPSVEGYPETRFSFTTEYDLAGRILSTTILNPDGSKWVTMNDYDSEGRLRKRSGGRSGGPIIDTTYAYDEKGRLVNIVGSGDAGDDTTFEYDGQGRKTRIAVSRVKPSPAGTDSSRATGIDLDNEELYLPTPEGGTVKTLFNECEQAIEVQVFDAEGQCRTRLVRTYDANGRMAETKAVVENPESLIPADVRDKILMESGGTLAELKDHLAQLMGGSQGVFRNSYRHDPQGRVIEKRVHMAGSQETLTKITYNVNGDKIKERSTTHGDPNAPAPGTESASSVEAPTSPQESEMHYTYEYDAFGNWTEQKISYRSNSDEPFTASTVHHRTISYY